MNHKSHTYAWPIFALCCAVTLLGISTGAVAAKVYKWKDAQGQVHFGQTPPPGQEKEYDIRFAKEKPLPPASKPTKQGANVEVAEPQTGEKAAQDTKPSTPEEMVAAMEKARAEAAKKAEQDAKLQDQKQKQCEKAQKHLITIQKGGRLYEINKKGEREYWDDSTRQTKQTEAQAAVDKLCN